jgi:hypothetical protein
MKRLLVFKGTIRLDKLDGFKRSSFGLLLSLLLAGSIDANTSLDSNAVRAAADNSKWADTVGTEPEDAAQDL